MSPLIVMPTLDVEIARQCEAIVSKLGARTIAARRRAQDLIAELRIAIKQLEEEDLGRVPRSKLQRMNSLLSAVFGHLVGDATPAWQLARFHRLIKNSSLRSLSQFLDDGRPASVSPEAFDLLRTVGRPASFRDNVELERLASAWQKRLDCKRSDQEANRRDATALAHVERANILARGSPLKVVHVTGTEAVFSAAGAYTPDCGEFIAERISRTSTFGIPACFWWNRIYLCLMKNQPPTRCGEADSSSCLI